MIEIAIFIISSIAAIGKSMFGVSYNQIVFLAFLRTAIFISVALLLEYLSILFSIFLIYIKRDKLYFELIKFIVFIPKFILYIAMYAFLGGKITLILAVFLSRLSSSLLIKRRIEDLLKEGFIKYALRKNSFAIFLKEILPNISKDIFTNSLLSISRVLFLDSFLSFLGIGIRGTLGEKLIFGFKSDRYLFFLSLSYFLVISYIINRILYDKKLNINRKVKARAKEDINIKSIENIEVKYRNKDLTFNSSTLVKGPSGIGKSSIFDLIFGYRDGEVKINSISIDNRMRFFRELNKKNKRALYLPQDPFLNFYSNVKLKKQIDKNKELSALLKKFKIDSLDKYPEEISRGEASRISISLALSKKPNYLFLDEPFEYMDIDNVKSLLSIISSSSTKFIVISHRADIDSYFDRVYDLGELIC